MSNSRFSYKTTTGNGYNHVFSSIVDKTLAYYVLLLTSLSIRRFWREGER